LFGLKLLEWKGCVTIWLIYADYLGLIIDSLKKLLLLVSLIKIESYRGPLKIIFFDGFFPNNLF